MRRRVVVTGAGLLSSLGDSPAAFFAALCQGHSGFRPTARFPTDGLRSSLAAEVPYAPRDYLDGNLRPVDRTGQLVLVAAQQALEAGRWTSEMRAEHEVGLVLGTLYCSVHTISRFDLRACEAGPQYAKPFEFANSVLNAAAGQAAIWHNLRGINSTLGGGTTAGLQALAYAVDMIRIGRCDALLAGGADELCFESYVAFERQGRTCAPTSDHEEAVPVPFDARRNGFVVGEGAALLMLEEAAFALERGAPILAEIRGHASAYDCSRGRSADDSSRAVARAAGLALKDAGLAPGAVDAVSVSANGSPGGDLHEALGLGAALGERAAEVPVTAIKSMLGEPLGASGTLQTLALIEALAGGVLPGIRGLEVLDEAVPLKRAAAASRELDGRRGLVHALGLDGGTCALVVERTDARCLAESL